MVPFAVNRVAFAMSVLITPLRLCKRSCSRLHSQEGPVAWLPGPWLGRQGLLLCVNSSTVRTWCMPMPMGWNLVCEEGVNRRYCDPTSSRRPRRLTVVDLRKMRARKGKSRRQLGSLSASARPASPAYVAAPLAAFVRLRRSFQNGAESEGVVPRHISDLVEHVAVSRPLSVPISHPCTEPPTPVRCQVQSIHDALHRLALSMEAK